MPNFNKQISSLIGGVSQQPDSIRFDNQSKEQINFFSSIARGIVKRFPTDYVRSFDISSLSDGAYIEFVEFPNGKRFVVFIDYETVITYDLDTFDFDEHMLPTDPVGLKTPYYRFDQSKYTAKDVFRTIVVGDNLLILNNTINVGDYQTKVDENLDSLYQSLVYCRQGNFGKTYKVIVNTGTGQTATGTYQVPDGSSASHSINADTSYIMDQLETSLNADLVAKSLDTKITVEVRQNIMLVTNVDKDDGFNVTTIDGFDDRAMYAINNKINLFSDLPRKAPAGFRCEVTGSEEGNFAGNTYWVVSKQDGEENSLMFPNVEWTESSEPGSGATLDAYNLPQRIGYFETNLQNIFGLYTTDYEWKTVGTDENASPSFRNREISGMFYWKNRLGFFTNTDVIMSESGNLFNFFPTSIAVNLTGDPIDISLNLKDSSNLKYAVPWQEQLMLFSDRSQAVLRADGALTTQTLSTTEATSFLINDKVTPIMSGSSVFFPVNNNRFTEVREYFLINLANQKDASNITAHIPTYIPKDINIFKSSNDARSIMMTSKEDKSTMYVYNYLWNGETKVMSSWNKYKFAEDYNILSMGSYEDDLYIILQNKDDASETRMVKTKMTDTVVDFNGKFTIHLDYRVLSEDLPKLDNGDGTFTYTLPYNVVSTDDYIAVNFSDTDRYGGILDLEFIAPNQVKVKNSNDDNLIFGYKYESKYTIGTVSLKNGEGQGSISITAGRTNLLKMIVNFADTVEFTMRATTRGKISREASYHGRRKGSINSVFGKIEPVTDKFKFPINQKNDTVVVDIIVDSHLPASFQFIDTVLRFWSTVGRRAS